MGGVSGLIENELLWNTLNTNERGVSQASRVIRQLLKRNTVLRGQNLRARRKSSVSKIDPLVIVPLRVSPLVFELRLRL